MLTVPPTPPLWPQSVLLPDLCLHTPTQPGTACAHAGTHSLLPSWEAQRWGAGRGVPGEL